MFVVLAYEEDDRGNKHPHVYGPFGQEVTARQWARAQWWVDFQVLPLEEV